MKVSIIMPAYNAERFISDAIDSVQNQSEKDWELIVIDDSSTDNTKDIVRKYMSSDSRIRLVEHSKNQGVSSSRMDGILIANSPWIAFLDSDDCWRSDKLQKQFDAIKIHPDAQMVFTGSSFITEAGIPYRHVLNVPAQITFKELLHGNVISCSSVMVNRDLMLRYPMEDDSLHEDYASWLRILKEVPFAYGIDEPLLVYRLSNNSKSASRLKSAKMVYRTYRSIGFRLTTSLCMTVRYAFYSIAKRRSIYTNGIINEIND